MKKHIFIISLLLMICMLVSSFAIAEDNRSFYISKYTKNINILLNGDMVVSQDLTYEFDGYFNGVDETIIFNKAKKDKFVSPGSSIYNGSNIGNSRVAVANGETGIAKEFVLGEDYYGNGTDGIYQATQDGEQAKLKVYTPTTSSANSTKKVHYDYTISDVVVKHSDVNEIYWNYLGSGFGGDCNNIQVNITFPEGTDMTNLKSYVHTESKYTQNISGNTVTYTVGYLKKGKQLDSRIVFNNDKMVVNKNTNKVAMSSILKAEKWITTLKYIYLVIFYLGYIALGVWVIGFIRLLLKYEREDRPKQKYDYYRELPSNKSPILVGCIEKNSEYLIGGNDIIAVLFDLIRRKYIKMEVQKEIKQGIFGSKEDYEYYLSKTSICPDTGYKSSSNDEDTMSLLGIVPAAEDEINPNDTLMDFENKIINFFFGEETKIKLKEQLDEFSKLTGTKAQRRYNEYNSIISKVTKMVKREYYTKIPVKEVTKLVIPGIAIAAVLFVLTILNQNFMAPAFASLFIVIILSLIASQMKKQKAEIVEEREKWKAFKRFIKDFSLLKEKEAFHVINWEEYMVYAIVLGVADKVEKELKLNALAGGMDETTFYSTYWYCNSFNISNSFTSSVNSFTSSGGPSGGSGGSFGGGGRRRWWRWKRSFLKTEMLDKEI